MVHALLRTGEIVPPHGMSADELAMAILRKCDANEDFLIDEKEWPSVCKVIAHYRPPHLP